MYANTQLDYRPKTLSEYLYSDSKLEKIIDGYVNGTQTRPLILYGNFGTGKSLLADLIPKAIDGENVRVNRVRSTHLNSDKNVYDEFYKNKMFDKFFCENERFNYRIIEEVNFMMNDKAKSAFRTVIEDIEGTDLVIMTTNEIFKIDPAIRSRSELIEVKPLRPEQFVDRAYEIIKAEGQIIEKGSLLKLLDKTYKLHADNREYYKELDKLLLAA